MQNSFIKGEVITPESPKYNEVRRDANLYFDYYPIAIAYVSDFEDVRLALKFARENNLKVRIRCGGHSAEAYSVANGVLVIDVSRLKNLYLDKCKNRVTIGAGLTLDEIYTRLASFGYQFTAGVCPTVGISGHAMGGGFGLSSRLYGLVCDNIIEIKMITYKGELVLANASKNSDLLWAVKGGGGGNFGVVVEFTFKVRPVDKISNINITYSKYAMPMLIKELMIFSALGDKRVTFQMDVSNTQISLIGYSYANAEETKYLINNFLNPKFLLSCSITYEPFIAAIKEVGDKYSGRSKYKDSGGFIVVPWDEEPIEILTNILNQASSNINYNIGFLTMGGNIRCQSERESSFNYRNALLEMYYEAFFNEDNEASESIAFVEKIRLALLPYTSGVYVNDVDSYIKNYMQEYYGQNGYKLSLIREKYNNSTIFDFPQIIRCTK